MYRANKYIAKMGKFCRIQKSGTYSEGFVLTDYKNTHFIKKVENSSVMSHSPAAPPVYANPAQKKKDAA
jgi:hypothetical protein